MTNKTKDLLGAYMSAGMGIGTWATSIFTYCLVYVHTPNKIICIIMGSLGILIMCLSLLWIKRLINRK